MPKVSLGRPNYEETFGSKLKASIVENRLKCSAVAKRLNIAPQTMSSRFKYPSNMTLGQLKIFIKLTGLQEEEVIKYLYERK